MSFFDRIHRLPVEYAGLKNLPAIPIVLSQWFDTLSRLNARTKETSQAKNGLSNEYTIAGETHPAYDFLYSTKTTTLGNQLMDQLIKTVDANLPAALASLYTAIFKKDQHPDTVETTEPLTALPLTDPRQFAMSWTTFDSVYENSKSLIDEWAATFTDPKKATESFWPMIARHGLAYNLLVIQKLTTDRLSHLNLRIEESGDDEMQLQLEAGDLYAIDMTFFERAEAQKVYGFDRFTPASYILLRQDSATKKITPFAITISGFNGRDKQTYVYGKATDQAWLYALQAAKTSITVYGIWFGHVYHWHLPNASLQMTMFNHLPDSHPVYQLMRPQADHLMAFNNILLLLWASIAPPTSFSSPLQFLEFTNTFSAGRSFFDDDPDTTIAQLGIAQSDFTTSPDQPWGEYPIVRHLLTVWDATREYVAAFVDKYYTDDESVHNDKDLQQWIAASGSPDEGNIHGLQDIVDKANLSRFLTSYIYRITMHGCSRLGPSANPALTFVGNFPPCLQRTDIISPQTSLTTEELLTFLPKTGTIGEMINFYFIFVFSAPYKPFLPVDGDNTDLPFPGDGENPVNQALVRFRGTIRKLIDELYNNQSPQYHQWPLNVET